MRRLLLLRHAEALAGAPGQSDSARPLSEAGRRAASELGARLRARGILPDRVLCSPATRTLQTWQALALNCEAALRLEAALYGAGAGALLARCAALEARVGCALLIGHNPGISVLAAQLGGAAPRFRRQLARGMSPCALAEFELAAAEWSALAPGAAELTALDEPAPRG